MTNKKVIVAQGGLAICPSCMSHITLEHAECPFCQAHVEVAFRGERTFALGALHTFHKGKSAMLAAALGISLSVSACGSLGTPEPPYGAPPIDEPDMGSEDMDEREQLVDMGNDD